MHEGEQREPPQTQDDPAALGKHVHLLIIGSSGAGHTSVEAVHPEMGW